VILPVRLRPADDRLAHGGLPIQTSRSRWESCPRLAEQPAEDADAYVQGTVLSQDAAGDLGAGGCPRRRAARAAKKFMYPQHTDADGPAQSPPVRPTYTTAVPGSQVELAPSTFSVIGWPVDGSADSITTGTPVIAEMPRASIAHMAKTVAWPAICTRCGVGSAENG